MNAFTDAFEPHRKRGGRPSIGQRAMTGAERTRRYRARKRAESTPPPLGAPLPETAAGEARSKSAPYDVEGQAGPRVSENFGNFSGSILEGLGDLKAQLDRIEGLLVKRRKVADRKARQREREVCGEG